MDEDFVTAMDGVLKDIAMRVIDARLYGVLGAVNDAKSKYGRELADSGIGVNTTPFFLAAGSWKELGDAWLNRKRATSNAPRFYSGLTGQLHADILAMPTERLFGKTQLTAAANVRRDDGGFFNPRLRRHISTVFRDERGRFASAKLKGAKKFTVRIDAFPELNNGTSTTDYINMLPISAASKMKLKYNKDARPLVAEFTSWFARNRIQFVIEQALKEVFK